MSQSDSHPFTPAGVRLKAIEKAEGRICDHCDGTGEIWETCGCYECEYSGAHDDYAPCLNCDGTGRVRL